jgi:predicted GNAT family acetyltransferase
MGQKHVGPFGAGVDASEAQHREDVLDETIEETFPASDAPANTAETGIRVGELPEAAVNVVDNRARSRFEITIEGLTATLDYERAPKRLTLMHTEVPEALRGRGIGERLVDAAVDAGHAEGLTLVVVCPFARAYLRRRRDAPTR